MSAPRAETVFWWAASAAVLVVVSAWQLHVRAPLTWEEARRVDGGVTLRLALNSGSPAQLWHWVTSQRYPILGPAIHGLVLVVTRNGMAATWLPAAGAFTLSGVLAARLARSLGAGAAEAIVVALLVWSTPISVRLASGAFTENMGACMLVGVLLLLRGLQPSPSIGAAVALGAVVAAAWQVDYDYGLIVLAVVGVGGFTSPFLHDRRLLRFHLMAAATAVALAVMFVLLVSANPAARDVHAYFHPPGTHPQAAFFYYLRALFMRKSFQCSEVGLASVTAGFLVLGLVSALMNWRGRPQWRLPALAIGMWLAFYSFAPTREARFLALIVPTLAALGGAALSDIRRNKDQRPRALGLASAALALIVLVVPDRGLAFRLCPLLAALAMLAIGIPTIRRARVPLTIVSAMIALALAVQVGPQFSKLQEQLWFVRPNQPATQALSFVSQYLPSTPARPVLMIGATTAFSPDLLQLTWDQQLGERSSGVHLVPEASESQRRRALVEAIRSLRPAIIMAVRTGPGSRLAPDKAASGRELFPSQRDYARIAAELGDEGYLAPVSSLSLETDPLRIDVWAVSLGHDAAHPGSGASKCSRCRSWFSALGRNVAGATPR